jgi:hypothetical protein
VDVRDNPIFFPTVPERNPRRECGCQPLAFSSFLALAPPGRLSSSRIFAVLLPLRASGLATLAFVRAVGVFFAGLAFLPGLGFGVATCADAGASSWASLKKRFVFAATGPLRLMSATAASVQFNGSAAIGTATALLE